jgi:hypothetical protein
MSMRPQSNTAVVRGAVIAAVLLVLGGALFWRIRSDGSESTSSKAPVVESPTGDSVVPSSDVVPTTPPVVTPAAPDPAQIRLVVVNAAKVQGTASRYSTELQSKGFVSLGTNNAKTVSQTSSVLYIGDQLANAQYVATQLAIPAEAVLPADPMPEFTNAIPPETGVIVIIGKDKAK